MDIAHLKDALESGMARSLADHNAVANNPVAPTFENTILGMERAGRDLGRVSTYYGTWGSNMSSPVFRDIEREMAPKLSAYSSRITQNAALFARVQAGQDGGTRNTRRFTRVAEAVL